MGLMSLIAGMGRRSRRRLASRRRRSQASVVYPPASPMARSSDRPRPSAQAAPHATAPS